MTYVPDDNFEQALIDLGYDTGPLDDSVPTANINTVLGLNVNSKSISDLTGIADFASLVSLDCFSNNLTSLDLSQGNSLEHLDCSGNFSLGSLDISGATNLLYLICDFCQLSTLDVTNNVYLEELDIEKNQIQSIDISQNANVLEFYCTFNQLTSIDVSHMNSLTTFQCSDNELTCLYIANGNNQNMTYFIAYNNPDLACIEVDDTTWANANWTVAGLNMDSTASFSDDCNSICFPGITLPDCSLLEVTDVLIDETNMTIDITIYNGDTIDINYPYVGLVVDAMGDTIQNGTANFFVQFALDTMTYSYVLNSVSPDFPLTVYFAYSDMVGGMGTDTCILTYTSIPNLCDSMNVTFIELDTTSNPHLIDFEIETFYTSSYWFGYCGFVLLNSTGDTVAYENINTAANVFGFGPNVTEIRTLDVTQNLTLPFTGTIHLLEGWFSGNPTAQCSFSFNISAVPTGIPELPTPNNHLLFITDILGRTTQPVPNTLLFYIYDDGSVEKKIQLVR
jgi:hypothetical protein